MRERFRLLRRRGASSAPAWSLVDQTGAPTTNPSTWTFSSNVASVDVVGLEGYSELLIIVRGVTASISGARDIYASVNNGSSFYTASGDYIVVATDGTVSNSTALGSHGGAGSTAARNVVTHVVNTHGAEKFALTSQAVQRMFVASALPINAIRVTNSGGGNLTGGSIYVYAR